MSPEVTHSACQHEDDVACEIRGHIRLGPIQLAQALYDTRVCVLCVLCACVVVVVCVYMRHAYMDRVSKSTNTSRRGISP